MYNKYVKRVLDLLAATILFALALPFFIVIAIIIKLTSRGPAIFTQERSGVDGKTFKMRKFRTMEQSNNVHDSSSEDNITTVGKFLRAFSLDELP